MMDLPVNLPIQGSSDACVIVAAQKYAVPADLMLSVRSVERGTAGRATRNKDGTFDFNEPGLNSRTMVELGRLNWDVERVRTDACYAMEAAALWMRLKLGDARKRSMPLLQGAATYNSATPKHNTSYQILLKPHLQKWACHLHHHWGRSPQQLFAIAAGIVTSDDISQCKPKQNLQ